MDLAFTDEELAFRDDAPPLPAALEAPVEKEADLI
jgi:hypothetical protein